MSSIKSPSAQKSSSRHGSHRSRISWILNRWTIFSVTSVAMIFGSTWYAYEQSQLGEQTLPAPHYLRDGGGFERLTAKGDRLPDASSTTKQTPSLEKFESALGPYIIEAPDVLNIEVAKIIPKSPVQIHAGDGVQINVEGTSKDAPIRGIFVVNPSGAVDLGSSYGKVDLKGESVEEAAKTVESHLKKTLREPKVSLTVVDTPGLQAISGKFEVGPDGNVNLGKYGSVNLQGKTIEQARAAIAESLSKLLENPKVAIDVFAYRSKKYSVIIEGAEGDSVQSFYITGNETVLDAIAQVQGLARLSSKKIWIARPAPAQKDQILNVDWNAITKGVDPTTNYQLLPNDRIFIEELSNPTAMKAADTRVGEKTNPSLDHFTITSITYGRNEDRETGNVRYGQTEKNLIFSYNGNETVRDAIEHTPELEDLANKNIWIARSNDGEADQILDVNWNAITKDGNNATNYKLMPNDRIVIDEQNRSNELTNAITEELAADDEEVADSQNEIGVPMFPGAKSFPFSRMFRNSKSPKPSANTVALVRTCDAIAYSMSVHLFPMAHNGEANVGHPPKEIASKRYTGVSQVDGKLIAQSEITYVDQSIADESEEIASYTASHYPTNQSTVYRFKIRTGSPSETAFEEFSYALRDDDIVSKTTKKVEGCNASVTETKYKEGLAFYNIVRDFPRDAKSLAKNKRTTSMSELKTFPIKEFDVSLEELKLSNGDSIYSISRQSHQICSDPELISSKNQGWTSDNGHSSTPRSKLTLEFADGNVVENEMICQPTEIKREQGMFSLLAEAIHDVFYHDDVPEQEIASSDDLELPMPEIDTEELAQIKLASHTEVADSDANESTQSNETNDGQVAQAFVSDFTPDHTIVTRASNTVRETDPPQEIDQSKVVENPFATNGALPTVPHFISGEMQRAADGASQSPRPLIAQYQASPNIQATLPQVTKPTDQKIVTVKFEVMELSRTKLRSLGVDWAISGKSVKRDGISAFFASPNEKLGKVAKPSSSGENLTMGIIEEPKAFAGFITALKRNQLVKVVAEPTMSVVSGRTANFHAGSEFPITKDNGKGTVSIEYKKVGTEISCKPTLLGNDSARLEIRPRLSEIDESRSITSNGVTTPGLRVREIDTGFELQFGQTAAICGMPQTKVCATTSGDGKIVEEMNEIETLILVTLESIQDMNPAGMPAPQTAQAGSHEGEIYTPYPTTATQPVYPNPITAQNGAYSNDNQNDVMFYNAQPHSVTAPQSVPAAAVATDETRVPHFAQLAPPAQKMSLPADVSPEDAEMLNSIKRSLQIDVLKGNPLLSGGASREGLDASQNPPAPLVDAPHNPDHVASDDDCPGSTPRTTQPRRIARNYEHSAQSDEEIRLSSMNDQQPPATLMAPAVNPSSDLQYFRTEVRPSAQAVTPNSKQRMLIAAAKKLEALAYELDEESFYDQADTLRATAAEYRHQVRALKGDAESQNPLRGESKKEVQKSAANATPSKEQVDHRVRVNDILHIQIAQEDNANNTINSQLTTFVKSSCRMAVSVVDVCPNGDLVFEGTKKIVVDDELITTRVAGVVSQKDVSADRTVLSHSISELTTSRESRGIVANRESAMMHLARTAAKLMKALNKAIVDQYPDIDLRPFVNEMCEATALLQSRKAVDLTQGPQWQPFGPVDGSFECVDLPAFDGRWLFIAPTTKLKNQCNPAPVLTNSLWSQELPRSETGVCTQAQFLSPVVVSEFQLIPEVKREPLNLVQPNTDLLSLPITEWIKAKTPAIVQPKILKDEEFLWNGFPMYRDKREGATVR